MIYKGCIITRTDITTDTPNGIRKVYAIEGAIDKPAAQRPFITSIRAAKEYICDEIEYYESVAEEERSEEV